MCLGSDYVEYTFFEMRPVFYTQFMLNATNEIPKKNFSHKQTLKTLSPNVLHTI